MCTRARPGACRPPRMRGCRAVLTCSTQVHLLQLSSSSIADHTGDSLQRSRILLRTLSKGHPNTSSHVQSCAVSHVDRNVPVGVGAGAGGAGLGVPRLPGGPARLRRRPALPRHALCPLRRLLAAEGPPAGAQSRRLMRAAWEIERRVAEKPCHREKYSCSSTSFGHCASLSPLPTPLLLNAIEGRARRK